MRKKLVLFALIIFMVATQVFPIQVRKYSYAVGYKQEKIKNIIWLDNKYCEPEEFSDGLSVVKFNVSGKLKCGYIDKKGKFVIPEIYENAKNFSEGLALYQMKILVVI